MIAGLAVIAGLAALEYFLVFVSTTIYVVYIFILAMIIVGGLVFLAISLRDMLRPDKTGLVVNSDGVKFNATKLGRQVGLVEWADIDHLSIGKMHGGDFMFLALADSAKYEARATEPSRETLRTAGLPVSHSELKLTFPELNDLLSRAFREAKGL